MPRSNAMPVRLSTTEFTVDVERPIEPRDYEREWAFDPGIVRFCIEGQPARDTGQFAPMLQALAETFGTLLLEGEEVFESSKTVRRVLGKTLCPLDPVPETDFAQRGAEILRGGEAIDFYSMCYAFIADAHLLKTSITDLATLEWFGSYWGSEIPRSFLAEAFASGSDRVEPLLLASLEVCSPVFFLSQGHCHLELMARDEQAVRLLEILEETAKKTRY